MWLISITFAEPKLTVKQMSRSLRKKYFVAAGIVLFILLGLNSFGQDPTITSFAPTTICQGETVTITGTNLKDVETVLINNTPATNVKVVDDKTVTATVSNQSASGKISVKTEKNLSATSSGTLTVNLTPEPALKDISPLVDVSFANCDGNNTYELTVQNISTNTEPNSTYDIDWGDASPHFNQVDWPANAVVKHTYHGQGYFKIRFKISTSKGCNKTIIQDFYNGVNPLASFTTTEPTTGLCVPASVDFKIGNWFNNSAGTIYRIDFGDGSPQVTLTHPLNNNDADQVESHTYIKSSCPAVDYTAKLDAINGCFTTTYTLNQIIVREKPKANFSFEPNPACVTEPVCFKNETIDGFSGTSCNTNASFVWDFGDGSTSTDRDPPCHKYKAAGTYTVTLSASNAGCGSDVITKTITVRQTSTSPAVSATDIKYCQYETAVPLKATGSNLLWYEQATGGTGSVAAPTPSTSSPGTKTYYVSQTISGQCESPRTAINVTVYALPSAPSVSTPVQLCKGKSATPLTATGTNLLWYTSATDGTGSSTAPTPSTNATGTVYYYVSQTTNGCEGPRARIEVIVEDIPPVPTVTSPVNYCQHQPASPLTANGTGLLWYTTATGGTGNPVAPIPSTSIPGKIFYYVSSANHCGESQRTKIEVNVSPGPSAVISYDKKILCNAADDVNTPNPPVSVTLTGSPGGTFSVSPSGLAINPTTGTITPAGATAGTYTIRYFIKSSGGCSDFSTTTTVTINSTPAAEISYRLMCSTDDKVNPTIKGTAGGTFTAAPGLVIDASTGVVSPSASTPGSYVVTYTIAPSAPCPGFTTKANIRIDKAPQASISYPQANFCNVKHTADTPNPPVNVQLTGTTGGSYSISPNAGLHMDTDGTIDPSEAKPGTYTITYTIAASGGCSVYTTSTTVIINSAPSATINYAGAPFCTGSNTIQQVSLTGTQGGTFTSSPGLSVDAGTGNINPSLSKPGTYTVTYTIAPSAPCPGFTTTTVIIINESPVIAFDVSKQSVCSGEAAAFKPTSTVAATVYNWNVKGALPPGVTGITSGKTSGENAAISLLFTNTGTASETVTIEVIPVNPTSNPCSGKPYELTLTVNPIPASLHGDTTAFCMHSPSMPLTANADAGNTVKWYDEHHILLNQPPVINTKNPAQYNFYATQTNSYGCESPASKFTAVVHPVAKIVGASYTNPTLCGIPSGSVTLNVLDLNDNAMPVLPVTVHYTKFQTNYSIAASTDASGKIVIPLTAGTYSDFYVETFDCLSQRIPDVFVLKDPAPPAEPLAGYNAPLCSGSVLNLSASSPTSSQTGTVNYVWVGPAFGNGPDTSQNTVVSFPNAQASYNGIYIVYAMQNNCISTPATFTVEIKQSPSTPVIKTRTPLCVGDDLSLSATSSIPGNNTLNYVWNGPGTGFPVNSATAGISPVKMEDAGVYSITVTSPETGCSSTADTLIQVGGYPIVKFSKDSFNVPTGYTMKITPAIANASDRNILPIAKYEWTPPDNILCNDPACSLPTLTVKDNVCYTVKATNIYGCSGSDTICITAFCKNAQVFIPNAFTPKGLAANSRFMVRGSGIASVKSFRVFNRWGRIVFEKNNFPPNDPDYGWDGYIKGKLADMGVYVYTVDVVCENGTPYTYKGNVTLLQ